MFLCDALQGCEVSNLTFIYPTIPVAYGKAQVSFLTTEMSKSHFVEARMFTRRPQYQVEASIQNSSSRLQ